MMNNNTIKFLSEIINTLNDRYDYAVLRNHEYLPEFNSSRDIDILINPLQLKKFQIDCINLAEQYNHKIIYTYWDTQFWTAVFGNIDDLSISLLQIDVLVNLNLHGIIFLNWDDILSRKIFNGKLYHLIPKDEFLVKFVYCAALGGEFPNKYNDLKNSVIKNNKQDIDTTLKFLLNDQKTDFEYWEVQNHKIILLKALIASLYRKPIMQIKTLFKYIIQYVYNLFNQRGLFITFSGPDGCGKTTLMNAITEHFSTVNPPVKFHFRPQLIPNLGEVAVTLNIKHTIDRRYTIPHRSKHKGKFESHVRLFYYLMDYILGYYLIILPLRWRKNIILFDRYFTDLVTDSERVSIFLDYKYLNLLNIIIPMSDFNFIISVNPLEVRLRKQELDVNAIEKIYHKLKEISDVNSNYYWIENYENPARAVSNILTLIFDKQHKKSLLIIKNRAT